MDDDKIDIRGFLGVLRRQIKFIFATVIFVLMAAFLYVYVQTPLYTASTLIQVDPAGKNILAADQGSQNSNLNDVRVDGEIEILRSDAVAVRVVQMANLMADPEFGLGVLVEDLDQNPSILLKTVIQNIQRAIRITRKGNTYLISASVTSENPMRAAELANILADAYILNQITTKVDSIETVASILRVRLAEARMALERDETAFDEFIAENIALFETGSGRVEFAALKAAYSSALAQSAQSEIRLGALETGLQNRDWASIAETMQSEAIITLERQRAAANARLEAAANGSQASVELRLNLASIDEELNRKTTTAVRNLRAEVSELRAQISDTQAQIRRSVLSGDLPPALLTKIYELQQSSSITRAQYDNFLTRLRDVELQADLQVADARVVSPALPPLDPSSQSKRTILVLAGILALGLGVGLAFLNEYFIGGFTNEDQLANTLQVPVGARIPAVTPQKPPSRPSAEPSAAEVYATQPMSGYAESIRRLRVALDQALGWRSDAQQSDIEGGRVIMIASTVPEEGKSNTALSLGRAYAGSGLRTLLIDCDLRKPRMHKILGAEPNSGMLDYLTSSQAGDVSEHMYQKDYASDLEVLLGAGRSNVPTDQLLAGPRFSRLIKEARAGFDIIILDTPPLLPLVDGLYLAHYADVIALLVKWSSTTQQDVRSILPALLDSKNKNAEIVSVLSQVRSGKHGYFGKYAAYYGNQNES
ncbi:MAG: hypothetical protein COB08_010815 [Rhodobacteraceae bacterium]|nr:hypothetical protein [Paracoccaceae bacterium]